MKGIYIHIPFCEQKCKYCDFLSFPGRQEENKERYLAALIKEMELRIDERWRLADTIFIGGGTPSALSVTQLELLMKALNKLVDIESVQEFSVECNPGTVDKEKLEVLKQGGVNRLSFGVQSFDDILLKRIGRIHSAQDAQEAVALAQSVGLTNINVDLMYGLPGQTLEQWKASVDKAVALDVQHLSLYQLIMEEGTPLTRAIDEGRMPPIDEEGAAEWFDLQREWLEAAGFYQYEISNYAQKGKASKHNTLYWQLDDYLGLGLGATSWERPKRRVNTMGFGDYVGALKENRDVAYDEETLTREEQMSESVFMALRMNDGLSCEKFTALYNQSVEDAFSEAMREAKENGWLVAKNNRIKLTDEGRRLGNWVFELFL